MSEKENLQPDKEGEVEPPPYETIMDIPEWKNVPPPPSYDAPILNGIPNDPAYPPPPPYSEVPPPVVTLPKLAYADFLPRCIFPGDQMQAPQFDKMTTLMTVVNNWLKDNAQFQVIRCESIERKVGPGGVLETESTIRHEGTYTKSSYVRGIRLWLAANTTGTPPQQIWYMNIVPQQEPIRLSMGVGMGYDMHRYPVMHPAVAEAMRYSRCHMHGMLFPSFESLDKVLEKLNKKLKDDPIPGRILTVESIDTKYAEGFDWKSMDPESCCWTEKGSTTKLYLTILRIFFVMGNPEPAEIDIVDFAPLCINNSTSVNVMPKFEPYADTAFRANSWLAEQTDKRVTNVQTVTAKLINNIFMGKKEYDLKRMDFTLGAGESTFIKVIRVPYVKSPCNVNPRLSSRAFVPVRYGPKISETMPQTIMRVNQWLDCTGARVIGVDTLEYEFSPYGQKPVDTEQCKIRIFSHSSHHWMSTVRLYFDGPFLEPPPEVFPPIPAYVKQVKPGKEKSESCVIV